MRHGRRNIKLIKPFYPYASSITKNKPNWLTDIQSTLQQPKLRQLEPNEINLSKRFWRRQRPQRKQPFSPTFLIDWFFFLQANGSKWNQNAKGITGWLKVIKHWWPNGWFVWGTQFVFTICLKWHKMNEESPMRIRVGIPARSTHPVHRDRMTQKPTKYKCIKSFIWMSCLVIVFFSSFITTLFQQWTQNVRLKQTCNWIMVGNMVPI